eukprot:gnl/TRDRNA2_/TRDRNA2_135128_c0_seq2.p1 gnl/TRDRNA2_/TRDRNA2_135128_c0~~gnl/TRDRNA2_/TRDRNA2_135128_c0_seq2.p1  ORF type:complete len:576 (+),score=108.84 gnl/TRDRNA2_/TRDRNA2_135128_c0_seq2:62-1789(+)
MSAPAVAGRPGPAWLWGPATGSEALPRRPEALPDGYFQASEAWFPDLGSGGRGPGFAKIVPVTVRKTATHLGVQFALVREEGADGRREPYQVRGDAMIPWYEGCLLLEAMETAPRSNVDWHRSLSSILGRERSKAKDRETALSAAAYVKRALMGVAVTGSKYKDEAGKEWNFRRDLQEVTQAVCQAEVEEAPGDNFGVREVAGYLPPWEAFCHPRCGIYQDFYLIRWAARFAAVDYKDTENGAEEPGATWEPDECLPPHLDGMRIAAKRRWLAKQTRKEEDEKEKLLRKRKQGDDRMQSPAGSTAGVTAGVCLGTERGGAVGSTASAEATPLKRLRAEDDSSDARKLWDAIVAATEGSIGNKEELRWQPGGGGLWSQICRLVDGCGEERRQTVIGAIVQRLIDGANGGPHSSSTRLSTLTVCEFIKGKKVLPTKVASAIANFARELSDDHEKAANVASGCVSWVLVHMFPQPKEVGWGWSKQGWTWKMWWELAKEYIQAFSAPVAFAIYRTVLDLMVKEASGKLIRDMPAWNEDPERIKELRRRLCKTSGMDEKELDVKLGQYGIDEPPRPLLGV